MIERAINFLVNWLEKREGQKVKQAVKNRFTHGLENLFTNQGFPVSLELLLPQEEIKSLGGPGQLDWAKRDSPGLVEIRLIHPVKERYQLSIEGSVRSVEFDYWKVPSKRVAVILEGEPVVNPVLQKELRLQYLIFGIKVLESLRRKREELARVKGELVI